MLLPAWGAASSVSSCARRDTGNVIFLPHVAGIRRIPSDWPTCACVRGCADVLPSLQSLEHASYVAALCGGSGRTRRRRGGVREEERRFDIGERTHAMSTKFRNLEKLPSSQSTECMVIVTPATPRIMNVSYACPITTKVAPPRYSGSRERGREIYCATPKMTVWGVARPRRRNDGWTDGRPRTNTQAAVYFSPPSIHVVACSRNRPPSPQERRGRDRRSWSLLTFSLCLPELTISPIPLYCRIHPRISHSDLRRP